MVHSTGVTPTQIQNRLSGTWSRKSALKWLEQFSVVAFDRASGRCNGLNVRPEATRRSSQGRTPQTDRRSTA